MRVIVPVDTTWAAFFLAIWLLCLAAIVYSHARHLISTRRAIQCAIVTIGGTSVFYLALYGMGLWWQNDQLEFAVRWPMTADWFSLALVLANLVMVGQVIYAGAEDELPVTRGLFLTLVMLLTSGYLMIFWALLPVQVNIAIPGWLRLPSQPDPFTFSLEVLLVAALTKTLVDWLKTRIGFWRMVTRSGSACLVTALAHIGWYSSARVLLMPTPSRDAALVFAVVALPLTLVDALGTYKRGRWLRPVPLMQALFTATMLVSLLVTNVQPLLLWQWATASMDSGECEPMVSAFKMAYSLNPKLSVPAQKIATCDNRRTTPPLLGPRKIAFKSDRDGKWSLFTMNEDGSNPQRLNNRFTGEMSDGISWTPDGHRLAFTTKTANAWYIYTMRADGSQLTLLKSAFYTIANPHWLPDGQYLTYTNFVSGRPQLYTMDSDGRDDHLFVDMGYTFSSAWSPNAPYLVFGGTTGNEPARLYLRSLDGTLQYPLTNGDLYGYENAWSPDGQRIAFTATTNHRGVASVRIDGTDLQTLTKIGVPDEGDNWHPTWSPDGQRLAFSSDRTGKSGVYVMNADGSGVRCLACGPYNSESPTWQP